MCVFYPFSTCFPSLITHEQGAKDAPAPRPNKRPRLGPSPSEAEDAAKSSARTKATKSSAKDKSKKGKDDGLADEFMQVMQPRNKGPSWKDADPVPAPVASTSTSPAIDAKKSSKKGKEKLEATDGKAEEQPVVEEASAEPVSDMDWLKRHTKSTLDSVDAPEKVFEQSDDEPMKDDEEGSDADSEVRNALSVSRRLIMLTAPFRMVNHLQTRRKRPSCRRRVCSSVTCLSPVQKMRYANTSKSTAM